MKTGMLVLGLMLGLVLRLMSGLMFGLTWRLRLGLMSGKTLGVERTRL